MTVKRCLPNLMTGAPEPSSKRSLRSRSARSASWRAVLSAALHLVGAHAVLELEELLGELPQLQHHRVGGEVRVELVLGLEGLRPAADAGEDALGGAEEVLRAALALVQQGLLLLAEGLEQLLALLGELAEELVELAEPPLELLELHDEAREPLVALLRRVATRQRALHRLAEQLELGAELGPLLAAPSSLRLRSRPARTRLRRENSSEMPSRIAGARERVADLQAADHLAEHLQALAHLLDVLAERAPARWSSGWAPASAAARPGARPGDRGPRPAGGTARASALTRSISSTTCFSSASSRAMSM